MGIEKAYALYDRGRLIEAEEELRDTLKRLGDHENESPALGLLARCLIDLKRYDEATKIAHRAIAAAPANFVAHDCLARLLLIDGDLDKALVSAQHAVSLAPDNPDLLATLAEVHLEAKRWQECQDAIEKALAIFPEHPQAHYLRAKLTEQTLTGLSKETYNQAKGSRPIALKSENRLYRLRPVIERWISKVEYALAMLLLFALIVDKVLHLAEIGPDFDPFVLTILSIYIIFVVLTWTNQAFLNMILLLQSQDLNLLERGERAQGKAFGFMLSGAALGGILYGFTGFTPVLVAGLWLLVLLVPVTKTVAVEQPTFARRLKFWLYPMCLVAITSVVLEIRFMETKAYHLGLVLLIPGVVITMAFMGFYQTQVKKGIGSNRVRWKSGTPSFRVADH